MNSFFLFFQLDKGENEDGVYQASGSANIILYVGLGMISIGLVITFVGLGDKGFRTLELKLIGPSLVGCGVFFALLRVLFCTVPSCCRACCKCCRKTEDTEELIYATVSTYYTLNASDLKALQDYCEGPVKSYENLNFLLSCPDRTFDIA